MTRKFFGTDGIRGLTNSDPMTAQTALCVGMAAGAHFLRGDHRHRVVIGKDTRLSGYMMESAMVADRRQLGQALNNVVKNAVEAIEARKSRGEHSLAGDRVELKLHREGEQLVIDVMDTGVGLPEERERLTEPYMTTRVRGTGLGLAIVKKIVEEHLGEIAFLDRPGGGTHVRMAFDADRLVELADASPAETPTDEVSEDEA